MNRLRHPSLKTTIIGTSILFTLTMTVLVISFSYLSFNSLLKKSLIQSTAFNLHLVSNTITYDLSPIISLAVWTETNSQLSDYLSLASRNGQAKNTYLEEKTDEAKEAYTLMQISLKTQALSSWKRLQEEYRNNRSNLYINRIVIGNSYDSYLQITSLNTYHLNSIPSIIRDLPYFSEQLNSPYIKWTGLYSSLLNDDKDAMMIPVIRPIYKTFSNEVIGWSYMDINTSLLTNAFRNYSIAEDSMLLLKINDQVYQLSDGLFTPLSDDAVNNSLISSPAEGQFTITDTNQNKYSTVVIPVGIDGWYLYQTLSKTEFSAQRRVYYLLLLIIAIIVIVIGFALTYMLTYLINNPVNRLLKRMSLIAEGDFARDSNIEWHHELGTIGKGINQLAENVQVLLQKRLEDEKEKSDLEYQILQSQINPHFLYNTLNSIKWMATIQKAKGIAEMTTALSRLLRSVTKENKPIHSLKEEIDLLDHYFIIQKYRYGGAIFLNYSLENPELNFCLVPRFSLQPIVENAIFHGLEPKGDAGHIHINIHKNDANVLIIDIIDDGIGMNDEQVKEVLSKVPGNQQDFFKKIGISNVDSRIRHLFGDTYGITIESTPGTGTCMTMRLPMVTQGDLISADKKIKS